MRLFRTFWPYPYVYRVLFLHQQIERLAENLPTLFRFRFRNVLQIPDANLSYLIFMPLCLAKVVCVLTPSPDTVVLS